MDARLHGLVTLLLLLASCRPMPNSAPRPVQVDPDAPDLGRLTEMMTGVFANIEQAEADPEAYSNVRMNVVPVWTDRRDGVWLYAERAVAIDPTRPYRQFVYHLTELSPGTVRIGVFELPGDPQQYAGDWAQIDPLGELQPRDLLSRPECTIRLKLEDDGMFIGETIGKGCPSTREGAAFTTTKLMVSDEVVVIWDRGFDAEESQVWGPLYGGYLFKRLTPAQLAAERATPAPEPVEPTVEVSRFQRGADYSANHGGRALLVMQDGQVVFEQYDHGFDADKSHALAGATAAFWGVLAAAAAEDGIIELDELASDTITEWRFDERKSAITIRQLLDCTSGLETGLRRPEDPEVPDRFQYAISLQMVDEPGAQFTYGPSHLGVFGELLYRKLLDRDREPNPLDYLTTRVLDPIGMEVARWHADEAGNPYMFFGAHVTAAEWAKLGELIRNDGIWNGTPVVDSELLQQCFVGSEANPYYGLGFWIGTGDASDETIPDDLIRATGSGHQRLYIIPSLGIVVARLGESQNFSDVEFLALLLRDDG